jgi:hypothetical protein
MLEKLATHDIEDVTQLLPLLTNVLGQPRGEPSTLAISQKLRVQLPLVL